jgi:imidazoleglycerol phosphate synthase glutamine amidotransferase subunit HisH
MEIVVILDYGMSNLRSMANARQVFEALADQKVLQQADRFRVGIIRAELALA